MTQIPAIFCILPGLEGYPYLIPNNVRMVRHDLEHEYAHSFVSDSDAIDNSWGVPKNGRIGNVDHENEARNFLLPETIWMV